MNTGGVVTLFFVLIAIAWGLWLIFKRDLMSVNVSKVVMYFVGVVLTLMIVLWITSQFLPWWTIRLVENTKQSENIKELQVVGQQLWSEAMGKPITISTPAPTQAIVQATQAPQQTQQAAQNPVATQAANNPVQGDRTHTVASGDTLFAISRRYGVSVDAIKGRNQINGDVIKVGQQLVIPGTP